MKLSDYLDARNLQLEITRHPNQSSRFTAQFYRCEVKRGALLQGSYGEGKTPREACQDYIRQIEGQRLVRGSYSSDREEFVVPQNIEVDF